jgi:uncharacterized membrane protein YsdA (DUF1294 family)/cold shock CspA family protein
MRYQGKITVWKDDRGFGFITPQGGGEPVFFHISDFPNTKRRPVGNEIVTYELRFDATRRPHAGNVAFTDARRATEQRFDNGAVASALFSTFFLALIGVAALADKLPFAFFSAYLVASLLAFALYRRDKSAAQNGDWRTSENSLHLLGLFGGWPGALIAQKFLHHKSKKRSFQVIFWATVLLNCAGALAYAWLANLD